jgi:hypothetical protein
MLLPESIVLRTAIDNNFISTSAIDYCHSLNNIIASTSIAIMPSSSSSPPSTVSLAVAAAAVVATTSVTLILGLIGGYYYRSVTSIKHREMKTLKVPKDLLKSEYNEELKLAIQLAMEGTFDVYTVTLLYVTLRYVVLTGKKERRFDCPRLFVCDTREESIDTLR